VNNVDKHVVRYMRAPTQHSNTTCQSTPLSDFFRESIVDQSEVCVLGSGRGVCWKHTSSTMVSIAASKRDASTEL
jgi:hypothetical protein